MSPAGPASLRERMRRLGRQSAAYTVVNIVLRGTALFLVPLYAHALTPAEYGIVGLVVTVQLLTAMLCTGGMDATLTRLYLAAETEEERRELCGSALVFTLTGSLALLLAIDVVGRAGGFDLFDDVPWSPYLSYGLWTGYLSVLSSLLIAVQVAEERPRTVMIVRLIQAAVNVGAAILLVSVLDRGITGVLQATLFAFAIPAVLSVVALARRSRLRWSLAVIRRSLRFSIAVVPHMGAQWALQLGDRVVLQRSVSPAALGLYTTAYSIGSSSQLVTSGFNRAFMPQITKQLKDPETARDVPRIGTYSLLVLASLCVAIGALGGDLLRLLTPSSYDEAADYVPFVAFAHIFMATYMLGGQGMWYSMRRGWMPVASITAATIAIGLTVLFVSWWGVIGAAIATVAGYFVLAAITTFIADRLYRIHWEYWRWARIVVAGGATLAVAELLPHGVMGAGLRALCVVVLYPATLTLLGFWTAEERRRARRLLRRRNARSAAAPTFLK